MGVRSCHPLCHYIRVNCIDGHIPQKHFRHDSFGGFSSNHLYEMPIALHLKTELVLSSFAFNGSCMFFHVGRLYDAMMYIYEQYANLKPQTVCEHTL